MMKRSFMLLMLLAAEFGFAAPVHLVDEAPIAISRVDSRTILVDFGRVTFGNILLATPVSDTHEITVHFGEDLRNGRVNRKPPGTVRHAAVMTTLKPGGPVRVAPPPDARNTQTGNQHIPPAVPTPPEWGVVLPFRWVEIEDWPGELKSSDITRKSAYPAAWDDEAASFECSDEMLNRIWELCRHSIKATAFAGVYIDGDRERIPYEADAYLNQLSHYATDRDFQMARDTFDWLMKHPTWPTEWALHMILMAHADYRHTGNAAWIASRYEALKPKLLLDRAGDDGLLVSTDALIRKGDIVDWPPDERDGYVFTGVNTVVNAFHIHALRLMAEMATAVGKPSEAADYTRLADRAQAAFQAKLFMPERGIYRDGVGTDHASLHANMFPLVFGLVPPADVSTVLAFVKQRGMACSVYGAQYLLEVLFANGASDHALGLMVAPGDRSWRHMVESGATLTWEAWDMKYKPNQDWNHAWGAAPANVLPRFVLGARPLQPGWSEVLIRPHPGALEHAKGRVPTPQGPLEITWRNEASFLLSLELPDGMAARLELPAAAGSTGVRINGHPVEAKVVNQYWHVLQPVTGKARIEVIQGQPNMTPAN